MNLITNNNFIPNLQSSQASKAAPAKYQPKPEFEAFLSETKKLNQQIKEKKLNFFQRYLEYPTISTPLLGVIVVEGGALISRHFKKKKLKAGEITKAVYDKHKSKLITLVFAVIGAAIAGCGLVDYILKKNKEKYAQNSQNIWKELTEKQKPDISLNIRQPKNAVIAAYYDPVTARCTLGEKFSTDPILAKKQKNLLKHELVHVKQFNMIARMDKGIEKLNLACARKLVAELKPNEKESFLMIYRELQTKGPLSEKEKNAAFETEGHDINAANYITALAKVISNPGISEDELPIFINKSYYDKVRQKDGALSKEEAAKAQEYFDAYNIYPQNIGYKEALIPKSKYKTNLLEKETVKQTIA